MARKKTVSFQESQLTKGQLRKLNALRKSVGKVVGERAFAEWLASQPSHEGTEVDKNADLIADAVWKLIEQKGVRIPRGGYIIRRGRGRVILEPTETD